MYSFLKDIPYSRGNAYCAPQRNSPKNVRIWSQNRIFLPHSRDFWIYDPIRALYCVWHVIWQELSINNDNLILRIIKFQIKSCSRKFVFARSAFTNTRRAFPRQYGNINIQIKDYKIWYKTFFEFCAKLFFKNVVGKLYQKLNWLMKIHAQAHKYRKIHI